MSKEVTIKDALSMVEKVQKLTELCYNDTMSNRFVALNDLTKKIRACFNALYLLPLEQNDIRGQVTNIVPEKSSLDDVTFSCFPTIIRCKMLEGRCKM